MHEAERVWLAKALFQPFDGPILVVIHHAPHRGPLAPQNARDFVSAGFVSALPDAYFDAPVLCVHVHTHESHDYRVGGCRVICNPRGYRDHGAGGNDAFDPAFVVDV